MLYDETNIDSILDYSKGLIGKTFYEVIRDSDLAEDEKRQAIEKYGRETFKGGLGTLLEEVFFGYKANSKQEADFSKVGIELKSSPYEIKKDGSLRAGERLSITMVPHNREIETDFYKSDVWHKIKLLLLIYYLRDEKSKSRLSFEIDYAYLLKIPQEDLDIIIDDYKKIANKVISGKAHEISESDTLYLGACTKGANAKRSTYFQFYGNHTPARARNFCLKQSYMSYVLNNYIRHNKVTYESVMKSTSDYVKGLSFEENVVNSINKYKGKTDFELCQLFQREYNNNKAQWADLTYRMLGIKSNRAEEFAKANIVVKAIRIEENGKIKENMSFPVFKYKEIINESWDSSKLRRYFEETKFLFVIFKKENSAYVLKGSHFWNMPILDLDGEVKKGWQEVVDTIRRGVHLEITSKGVKNNLLKKTDNKIIHVRPHAQKSYHRFLDGTVVGNGKMSDANQLPDGRYMTNYCFWINNDYIKEQIKKEYRD